MQQIPKIIHQVWISDNPEKGGQVPDQWQDFVDSWKRKHKEWEYILWTNERARDFVVSSFPSFLQMYDDYDYVIEKADSIRYLILEKMGGIYVDLDMECLLPIDDLIEGRQCILASEPKEHFTFFSTFLEQDKKTPNNGFIASVPNHPFWPIVRTTLKNRFLKTSEYGKTPRAVLERTGPGMLTEALVNYSAAGEEALHILDAHIINPLSKGDSGFKKLHSSPNSVKKRLIEQGTYAIHYWSSIWWPPKRIEPLNNPNPIKITGFKFYQGVCPNQYRLAELNQGRDINLLAKECLIKPEIVAFDTDGHTMLMVDLPIEWIKRIGAAENEGLYLRKGAATLLKIYKANIPYFIANKLGFMHWPPWFRKIP